MVRIFISFFNGISGLHMMVYKDYISHKEGSQGSPVEIATSWEFTLFPPNENSTSWPKLCPLTVI